MNSKKTRIIVISLMAIVISIVVFLTAYFRSQQKQNDALLDPFIAATKGVAGNLHDAVNGKNEDFELAMNGVMTYFNILIETLPNLQYVYGSEFDEIAVLQISMKDAYDQFVSVFNTWGTDKGMSLEAKEQLMLLNESFEDFLHSVLRDNGTLTPKIYDKTYFSEIINSFSAQLRKLRD